MHNDIIEATPVLATIIKLVENSEVTKAAILDDTEETDEKRQKLLSFLTEPTKAKP